VIVVGEETQIQIQGGAEGDRWSPLEKETGTGGGGEEDGGKEGRGKGRERGGGREGRGRRELVLFERPKEEACPMPVPCPCPCEPGRRFNYFHFLFFASVHRPCLRCLPGLVRAIRLQ
jgi:hypothetical protein